MQAKSWSFIEVVSSTAFGFSVSLLANAYVLPLFGLAVTWHDSFWIAVVFTFISIARSYIFRRVFNRISG